ncbi:hypothetical protein ACVWXM_009151 [Bradyrhizobium sp. GM7.3]
MSMPSTTLVRTRRLRRASAQPWMPTRRRRFAGGVGEPLRVDADQRVKSFDRIAGSLRDRIEHGLAPMPVVGECLDQIVLALEVEIDRTVAQPRPFDDVGHPGLVKTVLGEARKGGFENLLPPAFTLLVADFRHWPSTKNDKSIVLVVLQDKRLRNTGYDKKRSVSHFYLKGYRGQARGTGGRETGGEPSKAPPAARNRPLSARS